jgi:hypothetical protein
MAEFEGMKDGLALEERMGCNVIIVESDSMEPVEACSGRDVWMTEPAAIYADCVDLVSV